MIISPSLLRKVCGLGHSCGGIMVTTIVMHNINCILKRIGLFQYILLWIIMYNKTTDKLGFQQCYSKYLRRIITRREKQIQWQINKAILSHPPLSLSPPARFQQSRDTIIPRKSGGGPRSSHCQVTTHALTLESGSSAPFTQGTKITTSLMSIYPQWATVC